VAHRIEIGLKKEIRDPLGEKIRRRVQNDLGLKDFLLFSESQSRFVVTVDPSKKKTFEALLGDVIYREIVVVLSEETFRVIGLQGRKIIEANIYDLKEAWQKPLRF